jgi:hypothetical protein
MYKWKIDPITRPWKVMCPSCRELFPKNDFHTYYRSGIDAHGVFEERLADQSLLVADQETAEQEDSRNSDEKGSERPDEFGADDENGYSDSENT